MKDDDPRDKTAHKGNSGNGAEEGSGKGARREPVFSTFDEEEDFEEAERDTDLASVYEDEEDEAGEEAYADTDEEDLEDDWQPVTRSHEWSETQGKKAGGNPWDAVAPMSENEQDSGEEEQLKPVPRKAKPAGGAQEFDDQPGPDQDIVEDLEDDLEDDWDEDYDDAYDEAETDTADSYPQEAAENSPGWPLGLIVVALVALGLLAAGGYGVIQQRAATQDEIRQLQSALATAASPAEVAESREALREIQSLSAEQQAAIETLTLENRRLTDTVAGLEQQLAKQQSAVIPPAKPAPAPKAAPKTAPKTATKPPPPKPAPAAASGSGNWFVNFSSYSQRATAQSWAGKLKPGAGKVVIAPGSRNGETFYRVRVVNLSDRAQAERVATQLQTAHGLPKLWVGEED
jgi:cell division septation protein DedD